MFPGFLTPVLTQLFIQIRRLLFSHASAEVRGENSPERKFASTGYRTHNHQVMSSTRSPLSHLGGTRTERSVDPYQPARSTRRLTGLESFCCVPKTILTYYKGNHSISKSWSQSFKCLLKFHSKCKHFMTWTIHQDHRMLASTMKFQWTSEGL